MRGAHSISKFLLLLLSSAWMATGEAQLSTTGSVSTHLVNKYIKYHQTERENIYAHFNKNIFFPGEEVWFSCYIVDKHQHKPFLGTKNLYAELFDDKGKCVKRQVLYVYGGVANGYFSLPDSLRPGQYYFKAYTSWSRNFGIDGAYVQPLIVSRKGVTYKKDVDEPLRMEFFPEGDCFLAGVENRMVLKVTDTNGNAVSVNGTITVDGEDIQSFSTNSAGIGHCRINVMAGKTYVAKIAGRGSGATAFPLPVVRETGVSLSLQRSSRDSFTIFVNSNIQSRPLLSKNFYLLVHQQGVVIELYELNFGNQRRLRFGQSTASMPGGISFVSLFDSDYRIVSERPVYVQQQPDQQVILEVGTSMEKDSMLVNISAKGRDGKPVKANLSMSVLPGQTEAANFSNNILTTFLLDNGRQPFTQPAAYFLKSDVEEMDDMLIAERYGYDWAAILNHTTGRFPFRFEQGFNIVGTVPGFEIKDKKDSLYVTMMVAENGLVITKPVGEKGRFEFPYLFLTDTANVYLYASAVREKKRFRALELTSVPSSFDTLNMPVMKRLPVNIPTDDYSAPMDPKFLALEEVRVKSKNRKKNPFHANIFSMVTDRVYLVDQSSERKYKTLLDLLKGEFLLRFYLDSARNLQVDMGRGPISFRETLDQPVLIVDGMAMNDLNMLNTININMIEAIAVNKTGNSSLGMRGAAGSIMIKTKEFNYGPETNDQSTLIKKIAVQGYTIPPPFFPHLYAIPASDPLLMKYGALFWKPDLQTDETGQVSFKFYCPKNAKGLLLRSEGITGDGRLLFDERRVSFQEPNDLNR